MLLNVRVVVGAVASGWLATARHQPCIGAKIQTVDGVDQRNDLRKDEMPKVHSAVSILAVLGLLGGAWRRYADAYPCSVHDARG